MTQTELREALTGVRDAVDVRPPDAAAFALRVREERRRRTAGRLVVVTAATAAVALGVGLSSLDRSVETSRDPIGVTSSPAHPDLSRWWKPAPELQTQLVPGTGKPPIITDSERSDLVFYAHQEGLDVQDFLREQGAQGEFGRAAGELQRRLGGDFLNAGFATASSPTPSWVVLRAAPDQATLDILRGLGADTEVRWADLVPQADYDRVGPGLYDEARRTIATMLTSESGPDHDHRRLQFRYATTDGVPLSDEQWDKILATVAASYPDELLPFPVDIEFDPTLQPMVAE